jgi:Sugar (and other) transporter
MPPLISCQHERRHANDVNHVAFSTVCGFSETSSAILFDQAEVPHCCERAHAARVRSGTASVDNTIILADSIFRFDFHFALAVDYQHRPYTSDPLGKRASSAPSHHSNAPIRQESQSILSALAVAAAAQWIANYIVSQTFPTLAGINLGVAYGTYTLMAILSFVFVLVKVKETRGLELEEMK